MEKINKKFNLNNSYFKNKRASDPDTILEIAQYQKQFGELPFEYGGENWPYDAVCERQKKRGIVHSQYLTPDQMAQKIVAYTDTFYPNELKVLDACCGTGQLTKYLKEKGFTIEGFDIDPDMVGTCQLLYPEFNFYQYDFVGQKNASRWDLIVANPPFEIKDLTSFLNWLSTALSKSGKAIILVPFDFLDKTSPNLLVKAIKKFKNLYAELIDYSFAKTAAKAEIVILELSDEYKASITDDTIIEIDESEQLNNVEPIITKTKNMEFQDYEKIIRIELDRIDANPKNPRKRIDQEELAEFAQNIKKVGLLQPVTLREKNGRYEIVMGERRWRSFKLNGEHSIPAIIASYTDDEVMEIALAENLLRKDLTSIEESNAFQGLLNTGRYNVEDLSVKFGKSETYIRQRLRLQNLMAEFKNLLDNGDIQLSIGLELSKYTNQIQADIYKEHFLIKDSASWYDLSSKEFVNKIERIYTTDLSKYAFEKSECKSCRFNMEVYNLFAQTECGRCTNQECLKKKRAEYTLSICKEQTEKDPRIEVCISPFDKVSDVVNGTLKELNIEIHTLTAKDYPVIPVQPIRSDFINEQDFITAKEEYRIEELGYYSELDEIETKVDTGEYRKLIYIGDNTPKLCYFPVNPISEPDNQISEIAQLENQDKKNKSQATQNLIKETIQLMKNEELPASEFTLFEDELLTFIMLDSLNPNHYHLFEKIDGNKLTEEVKYNISKDLSTEQRVIIHRDFLIRHMIEISDASQLNRKAFLLCEYAKQHFTLKASEIQKKHYDNYIKRNKKIRERIENLKLGKKSTVESSMELVNAE